LPGHYRPLNGDDSGAETLSQNQAGDTHYRRIPDCRMSLEPILDFLWVHVEAGPDDNFLPASYQVDKPFLAHDPPVARQKTSLLVERPDPSLRAADDSPS